MKIYHNPRCRKSRETLNLIQQHGVDVEIVEYLKSPPTKAELELLLAQLNMKPEELLRKKEKVFIANYKGLDFSDEEWIQVMLDNPVLIERPIVVKGNKAVIGRPPENVEELFERSR